MVNQHEFFGRRWRPAFLLAFLCLGMTLQAQEPNTLDFYNGNERYTVRALPDRQPPYIHLNDLLRGLGLLPGQIADGKLTAQINHRPLTLDPQTQSVQFQGVTMPQGMRVIAGDYYLEVTGLTRVFSQLLGRQMVYEPVSKSLHIPADKTFSVRLITRNIGRDFQLEAVYSRATNAPKVERINQQLLIKIYESPIQIERADFASNQAIAGMEVFERLPDGSTELLFQLNPAVAEHKVEPFNRRNPRTIVHFSGAFSALDTDGAVTEVATGQDPVGLRRIVIDPGHGGKDRGAIGPTGLKEKEVTLDLARRLKRALDREGRYEVTLTRTQDASLSLKARTGMANNFKADLFVSIHLNAVPTRNARGSETYYLSLEEDSQFDSDHYAEAEGEENDVSEEQDELELILWDMAQAKHLEDSFRVAKYIQDEFNELAGIHSRGVKQAPMKVLKGAQMPAILVEVAFLTDPVEERKLKAPGFRQDIIHAMVSAIRKYDLEVQRRSREFTHGNKEGH